MIGAAAAATAAAGAPGSGINIPSAGVPQGQVNNTYAKSRSGFPQSQVIFMTQETHHKG